MGTEERTKYDALAREDKARYEVEKANYKEEKGATSKKKQRDPDAPKRPMSAFLAFANSRRGEVKAQNRDCSNGEISKLLSNMWKEFPDEPKQKYRDDEAALWAIYKEGMVEWRKKNDGRKKASKALLADSRKKRKKKSKDDDQPSVNESAFDDHQLSGLGGHGLGGHGLGYDPAGNPNQDEMMAASALRGVRGGPNFPLGPGAGPGISGNPAGAGFDGGMAQQAQLQQGAGGYGSLFAMNSMSAGSPYGSGVAGASGNPAAAGGFGQDMGNTTNRALLEMGFPYQQYGGYPLGNSQAMLMAQALRGAPASYHNQLLGFAGNESAYEVTTISLAAIFAGSHSPFCLFCRSTAAAFSTRFTCRDSEWRSWGTGSCSRNGHGHGSFYERQFWW
jgi:hypothetical protein